MYAICDLVTHALVRIATSGRNLVTAAGETISDASRLSRADLLAKGVIPITDPGQPDQTWQRVVGDGREVIEWPNATLDYDTEPLSLAEAKAKRRAEIKAARDASALGGVAWERAPGEVYVVDTDNVAQARLTAAVVMQADTIWRMADNRMVSLTAAEVQAMAIAAGLHVQAQFAAQAEREAALDACETLDEVIAFDPGEGFTAAPDLTGEGA